MQIIEKFTTKKKNYKFTKKQKIANYREIYYKYIFCR